MQQSDARQRMVEAAVKLLATRGLEGTSFSDVLAASGAPRGSVYHYFPDGKVQLVHAALDMASERGLGFLQDSRGKSAAEVVGRFLDLWRALLDRSHMSAGCAVLAVTVAADDSRLLGHAGEIFRTWTACLAELLAESGVEEAPRLAATLVAAAEGAVAMCRAQGSREPFDHVSATMLSLVEERRPPLG
ncbi:MAG: hypothetical protein JWR80_1743 [Bradyrhizobium sp.]|nr:hypothetical protein [Bradyrhizobium sp.]